MALVIDVSTPSRDFASWSHGVMETLILIYRLQILLTTFQGLIRRFQLPSDISLIMNLFVVRVSQIKIVFPAPDQNETVEDVLCKS